MNLKSLTYKSKVASIALVLFSLLLLFDFLIFEKLLLNLPNEMEWDTSHWYNFAYARAHIKEPSKGKKIILTGSSVALYSALPEQLFKNTDRQIETKFYSHVALAPTDLYYYKEDIAAAKPDLVVYMLNFADLQWEYVNIKEGKFVFNESLWISEYSDRFPARTYYPYEFLRDYFTKLNKKEISRLAAKSLLYVNRYRHFFFDPIETWFDNHLRSGRSFQKYNGSVPREGIWSKGWTKSTATMACKFDREKEDSIFLLKNQTNIKVTLYENSNGDDFKIEELKIIGDTVLAFDKTGWVSFPWDKVSRTLNLSSAVVKLEILNGMGTAMEANLFHYGKDYPVGVRLSHYFCKAPSFENKSYIRESYLDEKRFSEMDAEEYDKDYFLRIMDKANERPELGRLNTLRLKKHEIKDQSFQPWFEYNQVVKVSKYFKDHEIPFMIVLTPENPIEAAVYSKDKWFQEMVEDLHQVLKKNNQTLYDHTNTITRKQYFFDPHHLTYDGAYFFNSYLEKMIQNEIEEIKK